ncbi:CheR family methyltransferase [Polynucleobacter sphagniphilus]|jgi:chemotaxis protein methyltransferase CheR|uniref:Chemotaxis protein methyltransferase CheR n=1 Tax=Polynucleobacter sphagniphilus TaxID=1743169 RepID=A0AA43S606_9BURK|nr:CheR family methyltransferase [Polynucleobacter sphagniphilus]MDH6504308.1 chemotaxis protein methyltransferase CheR [Polynucleobacter sphagniphilus]MDH6512134.1 chemotaxis protein methyltransferase CheR [Polynucleobacter sphagniphilus]
MQNILTDELMQKISDVSGLRVSQSDHPELLSYLEGRIKELSLSSISAYLSFLSVGKDLSEERERLSELLTTGETYFMRDPGQMTLIGSVILPRLIEKNRLKKQLRLWAPACATGEEVYSLVILLDHLIPDSENWVIDIIGSDINSEFIEKARVASYRDWSFRGCDSEFKRRYFHQGNNCWVLNETLRIKARFLVLDLIGEQLPNISKNLFEVDFILCRNIFIYMNISAINSITEKLSACLTNGGILMTAHGELHAYRQSGLQVKVYPESLVYEKVEKPELSYRTQRVAEPRAFELKPPKTAFVQSSYTLKLDTPEPSSEDLMLAAWEFADQAKFSEAIALYDKLLSRDPMQAELHYLHAFISLEMGHLEEAKADLRKTLYLDPDFVPAYLEMITIHMQEGKNQIAFSECDRAIKALEKFNPNDLIPILKNSTVFDIKQYLTYVQNSLTSSSD